MIKNIPLFLFKFFLIIAFTFSSTLQFANSILPPSEKQTLYQHLVEVNQEWENHSFDLPFLQKEIIFTNDNQRIQMHLMLVGKVLRKRNVTKLSPQQLIKRNHHLDVLNAYWQKSVFPINISHQKRQAYFIDHLGTACAVGHLVREDGGKAFTNKIKQENNFAYINELQNIYPEFKSWAYNNGFTLEELAWIQPGYPPAAQSWSAIGNGGGVAGHINVMKTIGDKLYMGGNFSSIDGVAANSIVAWNGNEWETLDEGVQGEIFAMDATPQGELIIGGNFTLNNNAGFTNIAMMTANGWVGLQEGEMNGSVYALKWKDDLYVGGDFENIGGQAIKYFAKRNISNPSTWNNNAITIDNAIEVNAPVRAIELINDKLLVGGLFTQTAPQITDGTINQLNTRYLAYWNDAIQNWETEFDGDYERVNAIGYYDEKIVVGGEVIPADIDIYESIGVSFFENNSWNSWTLFQLDTLEGDGLVHGFLEFNDEFFTYGDITNTGYIVGGQTSNNGFVGLYTTGQKGAVFDKQLRAVEAFQGEVYFAGDFTEVSTGWGGSDGGTFEGLVKSPLNGLTAVDDNFITNKLQVYHTAGQLHVNYEDLENKAALNIYNIQGQVLKTIYLHEGVANEVYDLGALSAGVYFYQIVNEEGQQSGKFVTF